MRSERRGAVLAALLLAGGVVLAAGDATVREALARAFDETPDATPDVRVESATLYLSQAQAARAAELAGAPLSSRIVTRYAALDADGALLGHGYVDTHLVRTKPETLLIVVAPDATVRRIEVLSFEEPRDYLPSERWYAQFEGRRLDDDLGLRRGIRTLSGATLSSRSTTAAVRRALAAHAVAGEP